MNRHEFTKLAVLANHTADLRDTFSSADAEFHLLDVAFNNLREVAEMHADDFAPNPPTERY